MSQSSSYNTNTKLNYLTESFDLSDADSDSDTNFSNESNKDSNLVDLLDKLELQYYPEPFNTMGQILLSSISGASLAYILNLREKKYHSYHEYLNTYFDYCKNVKTDNYVNELLQNLKIDPTNEEHNTKKNKIFGNLNELAKTLMDELISANKESYAKYGLVSDQEFSVDSFNADVLKDLLKMIKFSRLVDLV